MHQSDDAGGARHVAFHVLHAGGGLDRNTSGVEADAFADERNRSLARSSAVPTHHHDAALACRTLTDAEKSVHAELFHRLDIKNFDGDAKLLQCPCAACEFFRVKDIGRFVDQIARQ